VGTPFLITALILIFHPPVATESVTNAIYLAVMMSFLWIFFTVVVAPYLALLPDWEKRTADYEALSDADVRRVISEFVPLTYRQVRDLLRRAG
jgi:Na+/melibiose symporter-like transporter